MIKNIILLLFFSTISITGLAQSFLGWKLHDRYFSVYAGTGWTGYVGELTNNQPFTNGLSHFNIGVEVRLYSKIAARVQFSQFKLQGSDQNAPDSSFNRQRNLSFHSTNYEWQIQGVFYFMKYRHKYYKRRTYEPYLAAGVGQTFYNPKATLTHPITGQTTTYLLRELGTETKSYGKSAWIIPVSFGIKGAVNEFLNLSLDIGYRFTFTGHLDDVSGNYQKGLAANSPVALLSNRKNEVGIINQQAYDQLAASAARGAKKNDGYFLINLNMELYLPRDLFKPKNGRRKKEKIIGKPSGYD